MQVKCKMAFVINLTVPAHIDASGILVKSAVSLSRVGMKDQVDRSAKTDM